MTVHLKYIEVIVVKQHLLRVRALIFMVFNGLEYVSILGLATTLEDMWGTHCQWCHIVIEETDIRKVMH